MSAHLKLTDAEVIRVAMRLLGQRTSKRKAKSSRENGKLGGRPQNARRKIVENKSLHVKT
jgi:hypothetical protein